MRIEVVQIPVTEVEVVRRGAQGEDGKSAYQAWLDAGHVGTEEDFFSYKYNDDTDYALTFLTALL
jgi:hypothetical protein